MSRFWSFVMLDSGQTVRHCLVLETDSKIHQWDFSFPQSCHWLGWWTVTLTKYSIGWTSEYFHMLSCCSPKSWTTERLSFAATLQIFIQLLHWNFLQHILRLLTGGVFMSNKGDLFLKDVGLISMVTWISMLQFRGLLQVLSTHCQFLMWAYGRIKFQLQKPWFLFYTENLEVCQEWERWQSQDLALLESRASRGSEVFLIWRY